jgi:futalosine hydrolase
MKRILLLIPTQYELSMIDPCVLRAWKASYLRNASFESVAPATQSDGRQKPSSKSVDMNSSQISIALSGFGLAVAGARTAQLLAALRPDHVVLMGIAGCFGSNLQIGAAYFFSEVCCYGIGAGTGIDHRSSSELGFMHWNGEVATPGTKESSLPITDRIKLNSFWTLENSAGCLKLLSVASSSGNDADVKLRLSKYPDVVAEDMEGFSVAAACQLAGVSLDIVRGISNQAGDRNHKNWQVRESMASVTVLVNSLLASKQVNS